jgi:gas vesicle protein
MNTGKVVLGVLAGVAVGAIVGILFAPEKGSVTRKNILNKKDDYLDGLNEKFEEFIQMITQKFNCTHKEAEALVAKGKARFEEAQKEAKNATV